MSAATIDRALHQVRAPAAGRRGRHAPPSPAIRRSVPVRTFDGWDNPPPGFVEADLVAHSGPDAAATLARLYAALRLFVNFFQPCFKLAGKTRDGAKVKKTYHPPATPYQRLLADGRTSEAVRRRVTATYRTLDPVYLLRPIRIAQEDLVRIADRPGEDAAAAPAPALDQFLLGLRTAWQGGEVRPTSQPKPKAPRGRRRPDPLVRVTPQLRAWFEAEPWRTSRELFARLQQEYPSAFPDGQVRTLQRRVKAWRQEMAHKLVFGDEPAEATGVLAAVAADALGTSAIMGALPPNPRDI